MTDASLPPGWAHVADLPLSDLAPRRVLADRWEEAGDPAGPALRQLCGVLDGRLAPEAVDAWPSALHRAAPALFPTRQPASALRQTARVLIKPFHRVDRLTAAQEAMVPVWRAAWRRAAWAIGPADEDAARAAVDAAYAAGGLAPPARVAWFDSPRGAESAVPPGDPVLRQVWDGVVRWGYERVRAVAGNRLWGEVWYGITMGARVRPTTWRRGVQIPEEPDPAGPGDRRLHFALSWLLNFLPMLSFWYAVGGVRVLDRLAGLWRLAEVAGECWPFTDLAILVRRPADVVHLGPKRIEIVYADGHRVGP